MKGMQVPPQKKETRTYGPPLLVSSILYAALVLNGKFLTGALGEGLYYLLAYASVITMTATLMMKVMRCAGKDDFTLARAGRISPSRMPAWLPCAVAGIVILICLKNIRSGFFIIDDLLYLPHVRFGWTPLVDITQGLTTIGYRPLEHLPWYTDYLLWGTWAPGFFMTNVAIHILNSILFFLVFRNVLEERWQQIFATLLFAVHPVCADLCVYLSQRHTLLAAFFILASLKAYDCYLRRGSKKYYITSLGLYLAGILVRESVCALPFLLVLWEFFFRGRDIIKTADQRKKTLASIAPFILLTVLFFAWRTYLVGGMGAWIPNPEMSVFDSLRPFLFTMLGQLFIQKEFMLSRNAETVQLIHGLLSVIVAAIILVRRTTLTARDYKALLFCFGWVLISSIPTVNLMGVGPIIPPTYVHLPTIGICLILGVLWNTAKGLRATVSRLLCLILLFFLAYNSLLVAKSLRMYRYPPIRKTFLTNLSGFIEENRQDSPPGTVFLIKDLPVNRLRFCHDNCIKLISRKEVLEYVILPVVTKEEAIKFQTGSEVWLPEILRNHVWLNSNEIHPYITDRPHMKGRGDVEGYLPCTGNDVDEDGDGIIDNIYVFRNLGPGCRILGDDFFRIYRFVRSPHWDLKHRRVGMKHPAFSDVQGKTWNAKYIRYVPDDQFEEVTEYEFFYPQNK